MVAKHPKWFADDERPEAGSEPATRTDIAEGIERVAQAHAIIPAMSLAIDGVAALHCARRG
jgi:hypothetical protein